MNRIIIVQGGQYGSEAKGQIAGVICEREGVNIAVRTGATNAGHTYYVNGEAVKFQQLPVAAAIPGITIMLGAGALIDPVILDSEVQLASRLAGDDVRRRLVIDYRAGLHLPDHAKRSAASGRHVIMGATGKGCSEALIDRIKGRGSEEYKLFGNSIFSADYVTDDVESRLNRQYDEGAKILLEGTQGQGLDLYLGPYPYTTHKQCGPGQWMLECGLSPALPTDIVMVIRTFPIRVAGNSGPMKYELSWPMLARILNKRRIDKGFGPLIIDAAVTEFESALAAAAIPYQLPEYLNPLFQHHWPTLEREIHRSALSNLNADAIRRLEPSIVDELRRLFEFTTVTKKLRRIAALDYDQLRQSARQIRPHRVAITFMNYVFPEHWFDPPPSLTDEMNDFIDSISHNCDAPISYLGWGPESLDVVSVNDNR